MATQELQRQWVTPTRFMVGLGIALVICVIGMLVTSMPVAGLFFGTGLFLLVTLGMIGGYFWRENRRQRRERTGN